MSDSKTPRVLSRATVREVLIVVAGILIAFSLDAWWDKSSNTSSLRQQANLVLDELQATQTQLQSAVDIHSRLLDAAQFLVERLEALPPDGELHVADTTLVDLMVQYTVDIGSPSMQSFLTSGGSRLIEDPEGIRLARSWPTLIEDTMDDQVFLRDNYTVPLAQYLRSTFPLGRSETTNHDYRAALFFETPEVISELEFENVELTPEVELLNLLNARVTMEKLTTISLKMKLETNRDLIEVFDSL